MKNDKRRWVMRLINGLLLAGTVWFVIQYFARNLDSVRTYEGQIQMGWLLLATFVLLAVYVVQALTWRAILLKSGGQLGLLTAVYIFFFGLLASYIPGRVWGPMGMISSASERGVPSIRSAATTLFTTGLSLAAASIVSSLIFFNPDQVTNPLWLLPVILTFGIVFFPELFIKILNLLRKKVGQTAIQFTLRRFDVFAIVSMYVVTWIFYGIALYLFARSIGVFPGKAIYLIGANAASYLAGYVAFFTPAGLGVREIVLTEVLQQSETLEQASWLALLSRIWLLVSQLIGIIIAAASVWAGQKISNNFSTGEIK